MHGRQQSGEQWYAGKVVLTYSAELLKHGHAVTVFVGGPTETEKVEEAKHRLGIEIVLLPDKKKSTLAYLSALKSRLDSGAFDIVPVRE